MAERPEDDEEGRGFLSRWSRRKRAVAQEVVPPADDGDVAPDDEVEEAALAADAPDEEAEANRIAAEAVDIEAMTYEDDFSIFLKRGVPAALKKQAMRQLWRSNPVLANLDGLNDYDENFADPTQNVYASLWQAGRGFLSEAEQKAQQATGRLSDPVADDVVEPGDEVDAPEAEAEIVSAEAEDADDQADDLIQAESDVVETDEPAPELEEEPAEPEPVRVSLRRRLQG